MATSGSKSVSVTSWDTLKFSWWEIEQSIANNETKIGWKLELISGSSGQIDSTASKKWSVSVNGTSYSGTNTIGIGNNATKTLASNTTTIKHDSNGKKTFSYSFSQQFSITFSGASIGTKSGSGTGTLDTIARKSTLAASNGTLGTALNLTVTRQDSSLTHTITYDCGSASGTIATKSSDTSLSWTPPLSLAQQNTTGASVSVTFTITTYTGNTSVGSNTKSITCEIPSSVKPTVSLAVSDSTGNAGTYGGYIQGLSKLKIVATASGSQGSTIKAYKTEADGKTYTAATVTTDVLNGSGTLTIKVTVTDSRGRTATASTTVSVIGYSSPKISALTVTRCNADGTSNSIGAYLAVKFSATITALNNKNGAAYSVRYKKASESAYTSQALSAYAGKYSVTNGSYVFPADTGSSYDIVLAVSDSFNDVTKTAVGLTVKKLWSLLRKAGNIFGLAFGKVAEFENVFEIAFQTMFTGGILHPTLEPNTDLNDVKTPNTYAGGNLSNYKYINCPLESGTFTLEVVGAGETDQVKQRVQSCGKTGSRAFERYYYSGTWGNWICVSDFAGTLLWDGAWYMQASQTVNLPEAVSKQKNGIVLVFTEYINGEAGNSAFHTFFIPKMQVSMHPGKGYTFTLATGKFGFMATKYLYISDTTIVGHADNNTTGTGTSGITYTNNRFILCHVIGV